MNNTQIRIIVQGETEVRHVFADVVNFYEGFVIPVKAEVRHVFPIPLEDIISMMSEPEA